MDDLPNYSRILLAISECRDLNKLTTFVVNAQRKDVPQVRNAALEQLSLLLPSPKAGSFEFAFWDMFGAYEKILLENDRPVKILYRYLISADINGEVKALASWVENTEQPWAFEKLASQGLLDKTAEKLVLRFHKRFEENVRQQARNSLERINRHAVEKA